MNLQDAISDLNALFNDARSKNEFEFVITLLNYKSVGAMEVQANLYEWFEALTSYKQLYSTFSGKNKARIAALLYSTFFENSDFYNIIGSLCRINLGYRASSYLFWKTKKNDRLLGVGEKEAFLIDLLADTGKSNIISFFKEVHYPIIRNSFFHSAYSIYDEEYFLHDSELIIINHVGFRSFNLKDFFYPLVDKVILFFDAFKMLYTEHFQSYKHDKQIGSNPLGSTGVIIGSAEGLAGIRIPKAVQFYGEWHDSGIWYDKRLKNWCAHNLDFNLSDTEKHEIADQLLRYEAKTHVFKNDAAFNNLLDVIAERNKIDETVRAISILINYGNHKYAEMENEENPHKKRSLPKGIIPFYKKALELANRKVDISALALAKRINELEDTQGDVS